MPKKLNILFATDFSLGSKAAINIIDVLERQYPTEVALFHAVESYWKNWLSSGIYQKEAKARLKYWQKTLPAKHKKAYIELGNPAEFILRTAKKTKSNLIVLGKKAHRESARYRPSTTIESVVRYSKIPVLVCKKQKIKKVLCGIDGSDASKRALLYAIDLCHHIGASLHIIHALPSYLPAFGMSKRTIYKEESKFKMESINKINRLLSHTRFHGTNPEIFFQEGNAADVILDLAEDHDYDLIVVGAQGHSLLRHLLIGTTTEKILCYTPCSLLVIK